MNSRVSKWYCTEFLFVGWPGWHKEYEIGAVGWNYEDLPPIRRLSLQGMIVLWQNWNREEETLDRTKDQSDESIELSVNSLRRFFFDRQYEDFWVTQLRRSSTLPSTSYPANNLRLKRNLPERASLEMTK